MRHATIAVAADDPSAEVGTTEWNAAHVVTTDFGDRYVATGGNDTTGDGLSPDTAYATIGRAQQDFPNTGNTRGGTIHIGGGDFTVSEVDLNVQGVELQGRSQNRTRLVVPGAAAFGIKASAQRLAIRNLKFQSAVETADHVGLLMEGCKYSTFNNLWLQGFGNGVDAATDKTYETGPCAIKMQGLSTSAQYTDFNDLTNIRTWFNYRGIVLAGGGVNFDMSHSKITENKRESVYSVLKQRATGGQVNAFGTFMMCYFVHIRQSGGYMIRCEDDTGGTYVGNHGMKFIGCETEALPDNGGGNHFFIATRGNQIDSHSFVNGGDVGVTPDAVRFTAASARNRVGQFLTSGQGGAPDPAIVDLGTNNHIWTSGSPGSLGAQAAYYA